MSDDLCGLTDEDYLDAALALLPEGPAFPRDRDSVPVSFWRGLTRALARLHARDCVLQSESLACTALETIDDWERVYGLPDACSLTSDALSLADRQAALCAKENNIGGQSIAYFVGQAAAIGYEVAVEEFRPFTCGLSGCGDLTVLGPAEMRFYWRVRVSEPRVRWFTCGLAELGIDGLGIITPADDLECRFDAYAPAQSILIFDYSGV